MNHIQQAIDQSMKLQNRSFVLVTEHNDGTIHFYPRERQPCWGELRKYELTAPGECTQPEVNKPGDLYHPFPQGKPIGLAVRTTQVWSTYDRNPEYMSYLFNKEVSPVRLGFDKVLLGKGADGKVDNIYFDGLNVDPTVLVWTLRNMYHFLTSQKSFMKCMEAGMTPQQAFFTASSVDPENGFYNTGAKSPARFLSGQPNDYSGGTMEQRVDYNRPRQDYIWRPTDNNELENSILHKLNAPLYNGRKVSMSTMVSKVQEIEAYVKNHDTSRPLHIWKTSKGVTNANPEWKIN